MTSARTAQDLLDQLESGQTELALESARKLAEQALDESGEPDEITAQIARRIVDELGSDAQLSQSDREKLHLARLALGKAEMSESELSWERRQHGMTRMYLVMAGQSRDQLRAENARLRRALDQVESVATALVARAAQSEGSSDRHFLNRAAERLTHLASRTHHR